MGNSCYRYRKDIDELKKNHEREINYIKSLHYEEVDRCNKMIKKQQKEIDSLHNKIFDLNQRCDHLLLDYYNLENDYAKCKNELCKCQGNLVSFRNIFSL